MTLNCHSLVEENYLDKLNDFVTAVAKKQPDIIALQEVNQTCCKAEAGDALMAGYVSCDEGIMIREDNHVCNVADKLRNRGLFYYWTWLPMKKGYDIYDEGIALMSRYPILETDVVTVSSIDDYNNWKTRKLIGIRTENAPDEWFYSVHFGWWDDKDEPFQNQWRNTHAYMKQYDKVWLMGDSNSPAQVRGEGYDMIAGDGWKDSFVLAEEKDNGITVGRVIDGWKEKLTETGGMRIDQLWCNRKVVVKTSEVMFNGKKEPVVSDHYGVLIDYERD